MSRGAAHGLLAAALLLPAAATPLGQPVQVWEEVYVRVRAGATVHARFHVSVEPGHVVVAPSSDVDHGLRPLALRLEPAHELQVGEPAYPPPNTTAAVQGVPEFAAYEGVIAVAVPITVPRKAAWSTQRLQGTLQYQACSANGCNAPAGLPVTIEVELRPDEDRKTP